MFYTDVRCHPKSSLIHIVVFHNTVVTKTFTSPSVDPAVVEQYRSSYITSPSKVSSCPCMACLTSSAPTFGFCGRIPDPEHVQHCLITGVMPIGQTVFLAVTAADRNVLNVAIVLGHSDLPAHCLVKSLTLPVGCILCHRFPIVEC